MAKLINKTIRLRYINMMFSIKPKAMNIALKNDLACPSLHQAIARLRVAMTGPKICTLFVRCEYLCTVQIGEDGNGELRIEMYNDEMSVIEFEKATTSNELRNRLEAPFRKICALREQPILLFGVDKKPIVEETNLKNGQVLTCAVVYRIEIDGADQLTGSSLITHLMEMLQITRKGYRIQLFTQVAAYRLCCTACILLSHIICDRSAVVGMSKNRLKQTKSYRSKGYKAVWSCSA